MILKIGDMVLDNYVDTRSFSAIRKPEYSNTWIDGWHKKHQDVARTRVTGKAVLTFTNLTDYQTFVAGMETALDNSGKCQMRLYIDTDGAESTIEAFVTYETKTVFTTPAFGQLPKLFQVTLKIEER